MKKEVEAWSRTERKLRVTNQICQHSKEKESRKKVDGDRQKERLNWKSKWRTKRETCAYSFFLMLFTLSLYLLSLLWRLSLLFLYYFHPGELKRGEMHHHHKRHHHMNIIFIFIVIIICLNVSSEGFIYSKNFSIRTSEERAHSSSVEITQYPRHIFVHPPIFSFLYFYPSSITTATTNQHRQPFR